MVFADREEAGRRLARNLQQFAGPRTVVLGLPRGGVVVAAVVARALSSPLSLVFVKKIGHPIYPEYAIGAVAEDRPPIYNSDEIRATPHRWLDRMVAEAKHLNAARKHDYYGRTSRRPTLHGKTAILVDDGIATGLTMQAALQWVRRQQPAEIVVAVPVAAEECIASLRQRSDQLLVLDDPRAFAGSVGAHYRHFPQVNDEEVKALLQEVRHDIRQTATAGS